MADLPSSLGYALLAAVSSAQPSPVLVQDPVSGTHTHSPTLSISRPASQDPACQSTVLPAPISSDSRPPALSSPTLHPPALLLQHPRSPLRSQFLTTSPNFSPSPTHDQQPQKPAATPNPRTRPSRAVHVPPRPSTRTSVRLPPAARRAGHAGLVDTRMPHPVLQTAPL